MIELPNETLLEIFKYMKYEEILNLKYVCKHWYFLLEEDITSTFLYKILCKSFCKKIFISKQVELDYKKWKYLTKKIYHIPKLKEFDLENDFFEKSLICKSIESSSYDHQDQDIFQTRNSKLYTFWSSKGSNDENSSEFGIYQFQKPSQELLNTLLWIDKIYIKFFKANWQEDRIYSCKRVSFSFGNDSKCNIFTTKEYQVKQDDSIQEFDIGPLIFLYKEDKKEDKKEEKIIFTQNDLRMLIQEEYEKDPRNIQNQEYLLAQIDKKLKEKREILNKERDTIGSFFIRVNYLGRIEKQPNDDLYYTCVNLFDVKGYLL